MTMAVMRDFRSGIAGLCALVAGALLTGCGPKAPVEPPSELWLRVHAAGGRALAADTNAVVLQRIAAAIQKVNTGEGVLIRARLSHRDARRFARYLVAGDDVESAATT